MTTLSILVVDDEPIARRRLVRLLAGMEGLSPAIEANDAPQAIAAIRTHQPDVLLLDIQMPGGSGFDVLDAIGPDAPAVVFVTAFDHYALRAFERNAVDYVTKPIEPGRLALAMARARATLVARDSEERLAEMRNTVATLRQALRENQRQITQFWVKARGEFIGIAAEKVTRFQADKDYVQIHANGESYLYGESLGSLERRLDPADFVRIHRSVIVRRSAIARVRQAPFSALVAVLNDGTEIRVGRTFTKAVRAEVTQHG